MIIARKQYQFKSDSKGVINFRSKEKRGNHIVIEADFLEEGKAKEFKDEFRKMIRKMNHLSNKQFSFEMHLRFDTVRTRHVPRNFKLEDEIIICEQLYAFSKND